MSRTVSSIALGCSLLVSAQASAQASSAMMLLPFPQGQPFDGKAVTTLIPTETDSSAGDDLDASIFALDARVRPVQDARAFTLGTEIRHIDLETDDPALPERLVRTELAAGMQLDPIDAFDLTWQPGFTAGVGFASSNALHDGQAWYGLASIFAQTRLSERSSLTVGVDYDGNRSIFPDAPLPLVLYNVALDEQLQLLLGYPINGMVWTPDERFTLAVTLIGIVPVIEATYELSEQWSIFAALQATNDAFHVADAPEGENLFFSGYRAEAGVRYGLGNGLSLEAAGGFAFNQEFQTGPDVRDLDTVRELDDAVYVRMGASLAF
jgi:hypothetical protein